VAAFSENVNDWQLQMVKIYKQIYTLDCQEAKRQAKIQNQEISKLHGLPETMLASSKAIKSLLQFICDRKSETKTNELLIELEKTTDEVHETVYR
jgi:hypothetical protein